MPDDREKGSLEEALIAAQILEALDRACMGRITSIDTRTDIVQMRGPEYARLHEWLKDLADAA
jgi:hypothetical protein